MEKEVQAGALEVIPAEDARLMFCGKTHFRIRINYIYFYVYTVYLTVSYLFYV